MKIEGIDYAVLGEKAIRLALASHHAKHKKVQSTVKDYILTNDDQLEASFLKDLFVLPTEEIIEKWFDGKHNANSLIAHSFERNTKTYDEDKDKDKIEK